MSSNWNAKEWEQLILGLLWQVKLTILGNLSDMQSCLTNMAVDHANGSFWVL